MLSRQQHLLALLDALGGRVGNRDFQKLLFLYCRDAVQAPYEFVPYKYGAFSFTSYADRRKLVERGLLADDEQCWVLSDAGRSAAAGLPSLGVTMFVQSIGSLRDDALVADTYRRFPYFAIRSEIANKLLHGDHDAMERIASARPSSAPGLWTIGYEGLALEGYLNRLLRAGISVLCDVRRNPLSRKYGFSKRTLANGCAGVGIRYEHLPELGIASSERQNLDTQADYDALFDRYEREQLPGQSAAIGAIARWIRDGDAVALTCYERAPEQCHRHSVAEAIEQMLPGVTSRHL